MRRTIIVALLLAGCAAAPTEDEMARFQRTIPVCVESNCETQWAAARRFVLDHSDFRIDIYTDDYIETHNTDGYNDARMWMRVTREPRGNGRYAIVIEAGCNNPFGCGGRRPMDEMLQFNDYVDDAGWTVVN